MLSCPPGNAQFDCVQDRHIQIGRGFPLVIPPDDHVVQNFKRQQAPVGAGQLEQNAPAGAC
jgi:hypothetical protein